MDFHSDEYKIASLSDDEQTINAIKAAEAAIASLTGKEVTLIAYERTDSLKQ